MCQIPQYKCQTEDIFSFRLYKDFKDDSLALIIFLKFINSNSQLVSVYSTFSYLNIIIDRKLVTTLLSLEMRKLRSERLCHSKRTWNFMAVYSEMFWTLSYSKALSKLASVTEKKKSFVDLILLTASKINAIHLQNKYAFSLSWFSECYIALDLAKAEYLFRKQTADGIYWHTLV